MAKVTESSGNVFLDLGFPPHEAAVLLLRSELAKRLGIAQPRVSEIMRGKIELMSLDYMVGLCAKVGVSVEVRLAA